MAKNWWENDAVVEAPNEKWWEQDAVVSQPQGRRDVTPFKVDVQQPRAALVRQAAAPQQVSADYSPSGDDFGSAIMAAAAPAAPVRSKSVLDNFPPVDRTKEPGFMLRPEFVDKVRNSFASVAPEKRRQALIDAAAGTDATAQAAQRILFDVQKEDKFLQEQEGSRQGMINIVRKAPRVKPELKLGDQPKPPVVFPDLTPTVLERADAYKTPESERIANRLRQDEATRTVVGAETSLEALADRADRESRDFSAEAFAKENPYRAALESGGRQIISGLANSIPTIVDFAARVIDATKTDVDTTGNLSMSFDTDTFNNQNVRAPTYQWADRMAITARSLMPEAGRQNMASAFSKGEFGSWLGLNLTAQAPQMATSFVAAILPAARPFLLPAMGAQSAGQSYGEGDSSLGALIKGGAEIVGERITLGVFDKSLASLSKLPLSLQALTVQSVGRALAATGKVVTTQAVVGALEETTTKILQNGVDRYLENKDVGLLDQTADAAVLGAFMEGPLALAQGKAAFKSGKSAFAEAFAGDVAGAQFDPAAINAFARRVLDVQSYDANIIRPDQTAKVQRDQTNLQQSTTAADAATAADNLSGSLNELLVPENAITPLPLEPTFRVGEMTPSVGRAGPGFDASALTPSGRLIEPGLDLGIPATIGQVVEPTLDLNAPAAEINPTTEQQFGLDKLRINAPRPQSIQGTPVDNLSNDQLQAITGDESVAPISRRSAAIELNARQGEAGAFTQRAAPQQTAAPSTVSFTRTMTPEELGAMPIRDRRALASQFDQTENEDGTITFTTKPGVASSTQVVSIPPLPGTEQTLGTTPVRDVGNQPVLDNETVRADAQRSLDRWAVDNRQAIPAKLNPAPEAEDRAVSTIANLLGSQFGTRVIAFHDTQPKAVQGVAVGGTAFVNTANVFTNVAKVSLHELKHTIEQIAFTEKQAGLTDTAAQKFTAQIDSIFDDMTDEGKRAYVTNFLHADELAALDATPDIKESRIQEILQSPVLRSEMTADFMGNRATDKAFWADVAKADPGGFKGFVQKWVSVIDNLMATLRGKPTQGETESAKVDQYVRDLAKAKMVAREALIAYRQGTLQQFESAPAASMRQGEINAPTIAAAGSENLPGPTAQNRPGFSQDGGGPTPAYGTPRAGAISVVGRHYSTTPRQTLSGAYYGQGLKGAERTRLDSSTDPRLKNRVYFYVDQGAGIRPESGVGGYAHETRLDNIYDPQTRLIKPQADANAFESAVINAGFDGYIAPFGNNQAAVVLLGQKHKAVPVKQIGQPQAAALPAEAAPTTLKKGLLSREASQVDTGNIPGSRMRMGTLEIPAGQVEAANAEMERIGSQIRFSKKEVEPLAKAVKVEGAKATAVVSAKPGREFKIGNDTASIVTYPKANDLEFVTSRLHARVRETLTGSDATNFLAATFGLKGPSLKNLAEIRGLWNTEREDTFAIAASKADGSPADFEDSRKLANLLGFAFIQEGAVTIEPSHKSNESIPSILIGKPDGSKLTRSEIDFALSAANDAGFFGASEALSGKGVKFLFFADDSLSKSTEDQYRDFVDRIATVQKRTGLTAAGNFNTNSRLDGANDYWTNATGQSLSGDIGGAGNQTASGEPSNIFRGTVDSLLAPYISALSTEGFKFNIEQWQRVFGATDAQASYLKLKLAELDNVNKHGVVPKLRQQVPITNLKQVGSKALITQKTTEANATEQLAALDKVLAGSSNPVKNTEAWLRMEAMAYGTNDVPMAPNRFIKMYNGDGIYEQLKSLSPGQVFDAQQGAKMGQEFRRLYESGKVSPAVTAKLMLWSFLSRGVSPYVQESAFVDLVDKIDPFIPRVLNGTFSDDDATAWNKIVAQTISKGSGQPGAATTHNANAFGGSFMRGMAAAAPNGRTKMQYLHELFSDPTKSGPEIRREFIKMGEGVGIDNKVMSFTLLVIGHDDVIVLDRVQIANTFNDGRLGDYNLYDGVSRYGYKDAAGKTVWLGVTPADYAEAKDKAGDDEVISAKLPGSGMANLTTGARGLMIYEPLEGALQKVLPGIFDRLKAEGLRSADTRPSVGRWHWEGWVAYSGQEASHKTLEALLAEAKGEKNPFSDVSAKEGEYGAFSYGTEYARDINGTAYKLYFDSKGVPYRFTLDSYKTLMSELKKKGKDGVVPTNFKVSTNEDGTQRSAPWFKDPRVNLAKFDEMIHRLGTANIKPSPTRQPETVVIFAGLDKRGLAKTRAEAALAEHPNSEKLKYVQDNFHDILIQLEDADKVKINCK